ncbi:MAG: hypothetical protein EZS28_023629 [Streblomastix strix]|uniref:Uncharacterized protein n=1 Tax=Streblomastix strix TaxID=222440 RepID=A0A5J4VEH9_9EUKA|nr:MAG: hypothetical protein EZS28_023629 [Streblomastix strix]
MMTPHQLFASERSFRTASESHRGSFNERITSNRLSSDFSYYDNESKRETEIEQKKNNEEICCVCDYQDDEDEDEDDDEEDDDDEDEEIY